MLCQRCAAQAGAECERHTALASVVQKYGHMYYHFVEEALPRMALLLKAQLPPGTKLLTWGAPYEYEVDGQGGGGGGLLKRRVLATGGLCRVASILCRGHRLALAV